MSGLTEREARELLSLYAAGDLEPAEAAQVEEALARYPGLAGELAGWQALEARLVGAYVEDPAQLLPLYAGDDLEPDQRAEVEAALAARPELGAELARFQRLEGLLARSLEPAPLSAAEARELLPLAAGEDLDPVAARQVARAVADDPGLARELAGYRALEARLQEAYAPAAASVQARVRVQCPYCHDALASAPVVLCGSCSTPHHAGCFEQNQGCSIFGCEGVEAVAKRQATLRVCGECGRHTQADAPFCAWCGTANTARRAPLHARRESHSAAALKVVATPAPEPEPRDWSGWWRVAAAVLVSLSTLGAGLAFGDRERGRVQGWVAERAVERLEAAEGRALESLQAWREAQARFLRSDWDGDGEADYAESLEALRRAARSKQAETEALEDTSWEGWFEVEWTSRPGNPLGPADYRVILRRRYPGLGPAGWVAGPQGPIEPLGPGEGGRP
ncbi:MAG: zf-HC2 domain-containing protein [Planctomycetota bacterium]